ncbi:hypothetical protein AMELA_G00234160, partial [Ameiurus melas]
AIIPSTERTRKFCSILQSSRWRNCTAISNKNNRRRRLRKHVRVEERILRDVETLSRFCVLN